MGISQKLELRQSQTLVMTPQLMQAIKLLQFSSLEVAAFVAEEMERNPLLEAEAGSLDPVPPSDHDAPPDAEKADQRLDMDMENVFPDDKAEHASTSTSENDSYRVSSWAGLSGGGGEGSELDAIMAARPTLHDHLKEQLHLSVTTARDRLIGGAIIEGVDDTGYFREPLDNVAERLGASVEELEAMLARIQMFEPAGIASRSLEECLANQLREHNRYDPAMQALIENLGLLARHDMPGLRRICGVDDEDLKDMIAELRRLNPKPGLAYGGDPVQPVVPDVIIRHGPDGGWLIELNPETLPRVLVNQNYYAYVSKQAKTADDKMFLAECLQSASWLTRSLEQRARTILKVASEIARQQDGFLHEGIDYLRPLNLKVIAEAISMHESTVSRVTANKYVATPRGIFELKYFFTAGLPSADGGESYSAETVRHRIRQMIETEPSNAILSDDEIVTLLGKSGVDVARRTVAKYREAIGIPSSVQRRRLKSSRG
jgi:RNA polymerase sigma-54 factor